MAKGDGPKGNQLVSYRGFTLVEVGTNYYQACRGSERLPVGAIYHGNRCDLQQRFIAVVDEALGKQVCEQDGE